MCIWGVCVCVCVVWFRYTGLSKGPGFPIFWPIGIASYRGSGSGAGWPLACVFTLPQAQAAWVQSGQGHLLGILTGLLVCDLELCRLVLPTERFPPHIAECPTGVDCTHFCSLTSMPLPKGPKAEVPTGRGGSSYQSAQTGSIPSDLQPGLLQPSLFA